MSRSSRPEVFCKKVILKTFRKIFKKKPAVKCLFIRVTDIRGFHVNSAKFLTILTGKTVFYSVQYKNGWLAASDLFDVFTQSIKLYYILY